MHELKKMMEKRMEKQPPMDENRKKAKLDAIRALHSDMQGMLGDGLGDHVENLKKVSVAAPDTEHLKEGLDKAKELVSSMPEEESHEEESSEETASPAEMLKDKMMEGQEHEKEEEMQMEDIMKQLMELKEEVKRLKGE